MGIFAKENIVEALRTFANQVNRHEFRKGRVVNVTDFGAFVDIEGPKDGLVFRADMTDDVEVCVTSGETNVWLMIIRWMMRFRLG